MQTIKEIREDITKASELLSNAVHQLKSYHNFDEENDAILNLEDAEQGADLSLYHVIERK